MKIIILIIFLLFGLTMLGQSTLKPAILVDLNGNEKEVYFKTQQFGINPEKIIYYSDSEGQLSNIATPENISSIEFKDGSLKFISVETDVETSPDQRELLVVKSSNNIIKKRIFLKQLISGKANLFKYKTNINTRFYVSSAKQPITLLEYQIHLSNDGLSQKKSEGYKKQIYDLFKCSDTDFGEVAMVSYNENDLINFLTKYNSCNNSETINFELKNNFKPWTSTFQLGTSINTMKLKVPGFTEVDKEKLDASLSVNVNFEMEYRVDLITDKWSILGGVNYNSRTSSEDKNNNNRLLKSATVSTVTPYLGLKRYFYINQKTRIYGQFNLGYELFTGNSVYNLNQTRLNELPNRLTLTAFTGIEYDKKYSLNMGYGLSPNLNINNGSLEYLISRFTVSLGYRPF